MSKIKANIIENVAGTETHDVATMGIENGVGYTKFPDGTLICYGTAIANGTDTSPNTFPHAFITAPSVTLCRNASSITKTMISGKADSITTTGFNCIFVVNPDGSTSHSLSATNGTYQAIGRWK